MMAYKEVEARDSENNILATPVVDLGNPLPSGYALVENRDSENNILATPVSVVLGGGSGGTSIVNTIADLDNLDVSSGIVVGVLETNTYWTFNGTSWSDTTTPISSGGGTASTTSYDNTIVNKLSSTNVQDAIDQLATNANVVKSVNSLVGNVVLNGTNVFANYQNVYSPDTSLNQPFNTALGMYASYMLDLNTNKANVTDVYTKSQVDTKDNLKVSKAGDTMTGTLKFSGVNVPIEVATEFAGTDYAPLFVATAKDNNNLDRTAFELYLDKSVNHGSVEFKGYNPITSASVNLAISPSYTRPKYKVNGVEKEMALLEDVVVTNEIYSTVNVTTPLALTLNYQTIATFSDITDQGIVVFNPSELGVTADYVRTGGNSDVGYITYELVNGSTVLGTISETIDRDQDDYRNWNNRLKMSIDTTQPIFIRARYTATKNGGTAGSGTVTVNSVLGSIFKG